MAKGAIHLDMILVFIVFITILSMTVIIAHSLTTGLRDGIDASNMDMDTSALNNTLDTYELFNAGIPFIFFSFMIIAIALAWYIRTTPIISFFMILIIAAIGYVAQGMSNAFYDFSRSSEMTASANEFGYTVGLMDNFGLYILVIGLAIVMFYFIKPKSLDI
jgi:hypothetical protein